MPDPHRGGRPILPSWREFDYVDIMEQGLTRADGDPSARTDRGRAPDNQRRSFSHAFVLLVALFISCLIAANIIAVKVVGIFGLVLPAAIIIFPLSYILGDVLTEVYGYHQARRVIWLGVVCNLFVVAAIEAARVLPAAPLLGRPGRIRADPRIYNPPPQHLFRCATSD
jgi:hypothetical protein